MVDRRKSNASDSPAGESRRPVSKLEQTVEAFVTKLKRREILGSLEVAVMTAELLRKVISLMRFSTCEALMNEVRSLGRRLQAAASTELCIGNVVRRVLYIVRQEYRVLMSEDPANSEAQQQAVDMNVALKTLLEMRGEDDYSVDIESRQRDLIRPILNEIAELVSEITSVYDSISGQAVEHIHANESILVYGRSKTILEFLCEAKKIREFEVYVAEAAPSFAGHKMAKQLAENGIDSVVITDSAIFALMPRINKVLLSTHAVLANGGLVAHTGSYGLAAAARQHKVPVLCITGLYKLSPLFAFDQDSFNEHKSPSQVLDFDSDTLEKIDIANPAYDYIPPEYIDLFIDNQGGHNPLYIYRLLADFYHQEDYSL